MDKTDLRCDWRYGLCDIDSMPSGEEYIANFIKFWRSKIKQNALPKRSDFKFEDFTGLHGWVAIDEISYNPFDMKSTLFGTKISAIEEREETGMNLSEYLDDPIEGDHFKQYLATYEQAALHHKIAHAAGSQFHITKPVGTDWIGLPCANDGIHVSHFISLVWQCSMEELAQIKFD